MILGVGLAYRWTVEPPASGAGAAILALMAFAAILALATWDPRAVRPAAAARRRGRWRSAGWRWSSPSGSAPARCRPTSRWSWKAWHIGGGGSGSASLDLGQPYGSLDWPEEPRVVMTVGATSARPIRA